MRDILHKRLTAGNPHKVWLATVLTDKVRCDMLRCCDQSNLIGHFGRRLLHQIVSYVLETRDVESLREV